MNSGIYCYKDILNNNEVVYVGKDLRISKNKRHNAHNQKCNYNKQVINRILQDNPNRYSYEVLKEWDMEKYHPKVGNLLEKLYIRRYNPKFNYTLGGEGSYGFKHSEESKKKISEKNKNPSKETRRKMSENKGNTSGYYRVSKVKKSRCKQGFIYVYRYPDENGKIKSICRVDIRKLREEVKSKGLDWWHIGK